jgi:hypothetical protein
MISYRLVNTAFSPCVCPRCQSRTAVHLFETPDGVLIETHHCPQHGDVVPVRSRCSQPCHDRPFSRRRAFNFATPLPVGKDL